MPATRASWSTEQLVEFLAAVSALGDEEAVVRVAVERAAESLEAEVGALVRGDAVAAAVGFPVGRLLAEELLRVASGTSERLMIPGIGSSPAVAVNVEDGLGGRMVLARSGEGFGDEETSLVRAMARVLALTLQMARGLSAERDLREESERQAAENGRLLLSLQQRQILLEKTSAIQRSITRRAPLERVLEGIIEAAAELLGDEVVALRMIDPDNEMTMVAAASRGVPPALQHAIERSRVGEGVGGRAISEGRLVAAEDYSNSPTAVRVFAADRLEAAMAAPVHESGRVVGSLTVASYRPGRRYSDEDRAMLAAFAEHASLALMDAKTVETMVHQALHDALTGLPNRTLFLDRLEHSLARGERDPRPIAVLFVDLDRFKTVNDSLGHAAGDELLFSVARRIEDCIRASDTAARLGGDEFAILIEDARRQSDVARLAERLLDSLAAPLTIRGQEVAVTASVGIAGGDGNAEDMLRNADLAMYRAKAAGKGRYEFFEPAMRAAVVQRLQLEADLRHAVERGELVLEYQPLYRLKNRHIAAVEALVRWRHPRRGILPPDEFIPLAEETGTIIEIGRWVLDEACRQAAGWHLARPEDQRPAVSVNLSCRQLQEPALLADVANAAAGARLSPGRLVLEITETVLMEDVEMTLATLTRIRELGVRAAIDDFGTGYSSLRYLGRFPIDILKIAKPFVDTLGSPAGDSALAQAIVRLGTTLGLEVVAEGIERPEQLTELVRLGCAFGQGFLLARPSDGDGLNAVLAAQARPGKTLKSVA